MLFRSPVVMAVDAARLQFFDPATGERIGEVAEDAPAISAEVAGA